MTDQAHGQSARPSDDLSYIFKELEDIEVDADGKCNWAHVANATTLMRLELKRALADWQNGFRAALACPVPAPVGLEREEIARIIGSCLDLEANYDGNSEEWCCRITGIAKAADAILALSPDHRTEPASAPIGQAEVKDDGR